MSTWCVRRAEDVLLDDVLYAVIQQAMSECPGVNEEEGGVILTRNGEYEFIKLRNKHTGTPTAVGLFEVDPKEYGEKVITKFDLGFRNYASFHTHPTGCRALPSTIDLSRLFRGFPDNFIWSPSMEELNLFSFDSLMSNQRETWCMKSILNYSNHLAYVQII